MIDADRNRRRSAGATAAGRGRPLAVCLGVCKGVVRLQCVSGFAKGSSPCSVSRGLQRGRPLAVCLGVCKGVVPLQCVSGFAKGSSPCSVTASAEGFDLDDLDLERATRCFVADLVADGRSQKRRSERSRG